MTTDRPSMWSGMVAMCRPLRKLGTGVFLTEPSSYAAAPWVRDPYRDDASKSMLRPKPQIKLLTKDLRFGIVVEMRDQHSSTCWQTRTGTMLRAGVSEWT